MTPLFIYYTRGDADFYSTRNQMLTQLVSIKQENPMTLATIQLRWQLNVRC